MFTWSRVYLSEKFGQYKERALASSKIPTATPQPSPQISEFRISEFNKCEWKTQMYTNQISGIKRKMISSANGYNSHAQFFFQNRSLRTVKSAAVQPKTDHRRSESSTCRDSGEAAVLKYQRAARRTCFTSTAWSESFFACMNLFLRPVERTRSSLGRRKILSIP